MRSVFIALTVTALLAGCATKEGIRLPSGSGPTKEGVEDFNKRNAASQPPGQVVVAVLGEPVKTALLPELAAPRVVIVGNVMALTSFEDATLNSRYDVYLKQIEAKSGKPTFTREWYLATSAGETAVKFSGLTGLYSRFFKAEIPKDLIRQITFASAFGTFMAGTSGDLVAAERTAMNGTWVTRLLCSEKSSDYAKCEAQYARGIYQSSDGREIDDKLQLVTPGQVINPFTYRLASLDPVAGAVPPALPPTTQPKPSETSVPSVPTAPTVAVQQAPSAVGSPASAQSRDVTKQLEKLNELRSKGLVTESEYQIKRKEILDSL